MPRTLIARNTAVAVLQLVPEFRLHLTAEDLPLYRAGEDELAALGRRGQFANDEDNKNLSWVNLKTIRHYRCSAQKSANRGIMSAFPEEMGL